MAPEAPMARPWEIHPALQILPMLPVILVKSQNPAGPLIKDHPDINQNHHHRQQAADRLYLGKTDARPFENFKPVGH